MTVEFIGMIHHREASEIMAPPPVIMDRGYVRDFAQAAEAGGFDKVLVGYYSDGPDGFLLAAAAAGTQKFSRPATPSPPSPPSGRQRMPTLFETGSQPTVRQMQPPPVSQPTRPVWCTAATGAAV